MTFYFLSACVFVLINLSIITFFQSFIIISSESLYQPNSRISLELCAKCWEKERAAGLRRCWNWRETINLNYSETTTPVLAVLNIKWTKTNPGKYLIQPASCFLSFQYHEQIKHDIFSHKMNFFFHFMIIFNFSRKKFALNRRQCPKI